MPANKLHDSATIQTGIQTGMKATLQNRYEFLCVMHLVPWHPRSRAAMFGKLLSMLQCMEQTLASSCLLPTQFR